MTEPTPSLRPAFILALLAVATGALFSRFVPSGWAWLWALPWLLVVFSLLLLWRGLGREWVSWRVQILDAQSNLPIPAHNELIPGVANVFAEMYLSQADEVGPFPIRNVGSDGSWRREMAEKMVAFMAQKKYCEQPRPGTRTKWLSGWNAWGVANELGLEWSAPEQPAPLRDMSAESV